MTTLKLPSSADRFAVYDPSEGKLRGATEAELAVSPELSERPKAQGEGKAGLGKGGAPAPEFVTLKGGGLLFNTRTHYYDATSGEVKPHVWSTTLEICRLYSDIAYLGREVQLLKQKLEKEAE